ncbi:radical SAM protein [Pseudomonas putida]|uniref:Radical SAM protein n=1 Tax=Pseudomonas putida TaxID=303 RepID=A0A8I1ECY7_PSEPU|nr:radical SAM protein [Pseudomonas putida]MBI6882994.1 radical SAM protein [Pseudomonas putida]
MSNDPRSLGTESFDHLVYVRLFEGCNLACEHCFIPANPKKMGEEALKGVPDLISSFAKPGQNILIQWHGGEPTLLGPKVIRSSIEYWIEHYPQYNWIFGIQTNLTTYSDEWRQLYLDHFGGQVGISWDPKIRLMRPGRRDTNDEFESIFWAKVNQLTADGLTPYLVVTGTRVFFEQFPNPHDFFKLMEDHRIPHGHIERLTKTGIARQNWDRVGLSNLEYSKYMLRFGRAYQAYLKTPRSAERPPIHLSPFDGLVESLQRLERGETGGSGCLSGVCDTRFHTIDANGYKRGCTAVTSEVDNRNAGEQVIQIQDFRMARFMRQKSCDGCEFRPICSSGCLASDKWDESGECSGGSVLFKGLNSILNV